MVKIEIKPFQNYVRTLTISGPMCGGSWAWNDETVFLQRDRETEKDWSSSGIRLFKPDRNELLQGLIG